VTGNRALRKAIALYIVRNVKGDYIGSYFANSARHAIERAMICELEYHVSFQRPLTLIQSELVATLKPKEG
jgi:hypothetical protein